jgi:class 3 adenylate cyclase
VESDSSLLVGESITCIMNSYVASLHQDLINNKDDINNQTIKRRTSQDHLVTHRHNGRRTSLLLQDKSSVVVEIHMQRLSDPVNDQNSQCPSLSKDYFIIHFRDIKPTINNDGDEIIHSLFPLSVEERLRKGIHVRDYYEGVTVSFLDICNFTAISSECSPTRIVAMLHDIFSRFDGLLSHPMFINKIYKIKTIGDSFMIVSGIQIEKEDIHLYNNTDISVEFAIQQLQQINLYNEITFNEIQQSMNSDNTPNENNVTPAILPLRVRIGIATGPVTTAIIGKIRPVYDVFGDTCNMASRMETTGTKNKIHITNSCYDKLSNSYKLLFKKLPMCNIKGKGDMVSYLSIK